MGSSNRATVGVQGGRVGTAVDRFNTTPTPPASGPAVASLAIAAARVAADRTRKRAAGGSLAPAVTPSTGARKPAAIASVVGNLGNAPGGLWSTFGGRS